jgi:lysophospholipase L1-like esterase
MDTMIHLRSILPALLGVLTSSALLPAADQDHLDLQKGDHIAIIGNGLADRMQHDGWLEAMIYKANPSLDLTVRTLAFSCDEVVTRLVTDTGASRSEWLAKTQSDVVLAFFGFNESFAGPDGLPKFKQELDGFLKDTLKATYNGKSAPRLVLFSPIAAEKMPDPNLSDPGLPQSQTWRCTAGHGRGRQSRPCAVRRSVHDASQHLYGEAKQPLTFNGIHLTESGDKVLAPVIFVGHLRLRAANSQRFHREAARRGGRQE